MDLVIENLKNHSSYPGKLDRDQFVFNLVLDDPRPTRGTGLPQTVYELKIPVTQDNFDTILTKHNELVLRGTMDDVRYQWPTDPMPCNSFNCATFPKYLDIPIPENTGVLRNYINELEKRGKPWEKK